MPTPANPGAPFEDPVPSPDPQPQGRIQGMDFTHAELALRLAPAGFDKVFVLTDGRIFVSDGQGLMEVLSGKMLGPVMPMSEMANLDPAPMHATPSPELLRAALAAGLAPYGHDSWDGDGAPDGDGGPGGGPHGGPDHSPDGGDPMAGGLPDRADGSTMGKTLADILGYDGNAPGNGFGPGGDVFPAGPGHPLGGPPDPGPFAGLQPLAWVFAPGTLPGAGIVPAFSSPVDDDDDDDDDNGQNDNGQNDHNPPAGPDSLTLGDDLYLGTDEDDQVDGLAGNDTMSGGDGDDLLMGGDGDDHLNGQAGADTLVGGDNPSGNFGDTAVFDRAAGGDWLNGRGGTGAGVMVDLTQSSVIDEWGDTDSLDGIQSATGGAFADTLAGNDQANRLTGGAGNDSLLGRAGRDFLDGGAGDDSLFGGDDGDTLKGGAGTDSLWGGDGNDFLEADPDDAVLEGGNGIDILSLSESANLTGKTVTGLEHLFMGGGIAVTMTANQIADLTNLHGNTAATSESLTVNGTAGNDLMDFSSRFIANWGDEDALVLNGGLGGDTLAGGGYDDRLDGEVGDDSLYGHWGDDTLVGGAGIDSMYGGENDDLLLADADDAVIDGGGGTDTLSVSEDADYTAGTFTGIEYIDFGDGTTVTISPDQAASLTRLRGGEIGTTEKLLVKGTTGNDAVDLSALYGSSWSGNDLLVVDAGDGDDNIAGGNLNSSLTGGAGDDTLAGGSYSDFIDGGEDDDSLYGHYGNDTMLGGTGHDTLNGYSGSDSMVGGDGNDTLYGYKGNDTLIGGAGDDTLEGSWDDDLAKGGTGHDYLTAGHGADTLYGEDGNDTLLGWGDGDLMDGGDGNDYLRNVYDDDTMLGGADNDTLEGCDDGDESLDGGAGDDSLYAKNGNDTLVGGAGADTLIGGAGQDVFTFAEDRGSHDLITDFNGTRDRICLDLGQRFVSEHGADKLYGHGAAMTDVMIVTGANMTDVRAKITTFYATVFDTRTMRHLCLTSGQDRLYVYTQTVTNSGTEISHKTLTLATISGINGTGAATSQIDGADFIMF